MLDFKLLNSQAFLNGKLIFRAFLSKYYRSFCNYWGRLCNYWGRDIL